MTTLSRTRAGLVDALTDAEIIFTLEGLKAALERLEAEQEAEEPCELSSPSSS